MANLVFSYFPNHFIILKTPPPQLQTSSIPILLQNRFLNHNTHYYSKSLHVLVSACTKSSSSSSSFTFQEEALSAFERFQLKDLKLQQHQSLFFLLRSFHFSDTQITKILTKYPGILKLDVDNSLKPKLQFLADYGFVGSLLPQIITPNPRLLGKSLIEYIKPTLEFLEKYVHTNDKVVVAVKRSPMLLAVDFKKIMQPKLDFLLSEGVTATTIAKHIVKEPRILTRKLDKVVNAVEAVKKLGLKPSAPTFLLAVRVMLSMTDSTRERRVQMYKSFGFSEEEIIHAFKSCPHILKIPEEKIRSQMDFYLNTMNLNRSVISKNPAILILRLSTRVRPRYNVIKVLKSEGLLNKEKLLLNLFLISEEKFMTTIVDKHLEQVPNLMELYDGTITGDKIDIQLH